MSISSVYTELYIRDLQTSINIFCDLVGMTVVRSETNFTELHHGSSRLLLNSQPPEEFGEENPIRNHNPHQPRGVGIELVVEVTDLKECYERVRASNLVKLTVPIQTRSWGRSDFRFIHPDGFYIRVTD